MKILEPLGAQGEVRIYRIDEIPAKVARLARENGVYVIGHSETGHHHVLELERGQVFEAEEAPEGMRILYALLESPGELKHLRGFDTHAPHKFKAGDKIMFRTDREYDPYADLARRVAD